MYISYSRGLLGVPDLQGGDVLCPAPAPAPLPPAELVAQELPVDLALVGGAPRDLDGARAAETWEIIYTLSGVCCLCRDQPGWSGQHYPFIIYLFLVNSALNSDLFL